MAEFSYTARNEKGAPQNGTIVAENRDAALTALSKRKLTPILVKEKGKKSKYNFDIKLGSSKVKSKDLVVFTRQLSTMISAGVPLLRALETLQTQTESKALQEALGKISDQVKNGSSLSDAMGDHPKIFDGVFVNMIKAGEAGGILDEILKRLATQVEKDSHIRAKIKGAMIYPSVISVVMIAAFFFLMTQIVPKLAGIFEEFDSELPPHTRIMLATSDFLTENLLLVVGGMIAGIVIFMRFKKTAKGKRIVDRLILKLPIFGKVVMKVNIARFSRTFSSLAGAGVSILDSLEVTRNALGNSVVADGIGKIKDDVKNGQPVSKSLEALHVFPPIVPQMIAVGEETGEVDTVLTKLADFYEEEVDRVVANITSIIEPILILFMGGLVGLIVTSVFGPITSLSEVVQ